MRTPAIRRPATGARAAGAAALILALTLAAPPRSEPQAAAAEQFNYGRFGAIRMLRGPAHPRAVVLFVSGDAGWNPVVASMAQRLADKGAVVAGIDVRRYLAELEKSPQKCVSPAADFENLSHYLQAKLRLENYLPPVLVGYSSGATLAYVTLAESPEGLFSGALSIGFCPGLDLKKPVCKGSGVAATNPRRNAAGVLQGSTALPVKQLPEKWISLQAENDPECSAAATKEFVSSVSGAEVVMLPNVGQEVSSAPNWGTQLDQAFERLTAPRPRLHAPALPASVADLPLVVVPAKGSGSGSGFEDWFAVLLSGDGGWVAIDKGISAELAKHNIPVLGWDSLKYFWSPRTPQGAAHDLDRVLRHYSQAWGKSRALLIGYSQGADTMPFMVNRLPPATRRMVGLTTLLGLSDNAVFEFHVANWLGQASRGLPTGPELERWSESPYLCLYGEADADSACKQLTGHDGSALEMPGGHHFAGGYTAIADAILSRLPQLPARSPPAPQPGR